MTEDITDPMSMVLQHTARKDNQVVFPFNSKLSTDLDKVLNMLIRRKLLKRIRVEFHEPHWKKVRGVGHTNLKITNDGLKAIAWK